MSVEQHLTVLSYIFQSAVVQGSVDICLQQMLNRWLVAGNATQQVYDILNHAVNLHTCKFWDSFIVSNLKQQKCLCNIYVGYVTTWHQI